MAWRREQLGRVGFDDALAVRLAATREVDLHVVLDLVARGCAPQLAARDPGPAGRSRRRARTMMLVNASAERETSEPVATPGSQDQLWRRLLSRGTCYDDAVCELRTLMVRAARYRVAQVPEARARLGRQRVDDVVEAAADEATVSVLSRLGAFEGRSRFTTWAYKFGILHASVELRRATWRHVEIDLDQLDEPVSTMTPPERYAESNDLSAAIRVAIDNTLTAHQRGVVIALLIDNVPIDVLAERLGSTRNALYKTLHDARKRLRADLTRQGYLDESVVASR